MAKAYEFKNRLMLRQIERKLAPWREIDGKPPSRGWIRTVRDGLGMSASQLAGRLGITRQGLADLERRERAGTVTLAALSRAARAMNSELVYAIVPRGSLGALVESQARARAEADVKTVSHTMRLEAQEVSSEETEHLIRERAADLLSNDWKRLWDGESRGAADR